MKEHNDKGDKKPRKIRSDKGLVMATRRDLECIAWIAEQYAIRFDQLLRLLSRYPDPHKPFHEDGEMAESTAKGVLDRWRRAGWVEYKRFLADEPGYLWVKKPGLALVGLEDIYTAAAPASTRLTHIYAVNQLRLFLDLKYAWKSERRYRSEQTALLKKGDKLGPIPDGVLKKDEDSPFIAVEVEISPKKPADLLAKMVRLTRRYVSSSEGYGYESAFPIIWFYVPDKKLKKLVETTIEVLPEDEKKRVSCGISNNLLPSRFSNTAS
jgi:hypothetical protein